MDYFSLSFGIAVLQIILIDILLGGDNAVVIALASRRLQEDQRKKALLWGMAGAVILRIAMIFFALQLLAIPWLKIVGAALLVWIGINLLQPEVEGHGEIVASNTLLGAIKTIVIADVVMSLDNVVAVAGASRGSLVLVVCGILFSIPIVVLGSRLVLMLMDRYPMVVTAGGALLGWIAGGMAYSDPMFPAERLAWLPFPRHVLSLVGATIVIIVGKWAASRIEAIRSPEIADPSP